MKESEVGSNTICRAPLNNSDCDSNEWLYKTNTGISKFVQQLRCHLDFKHLAHMCL